MSHYRCKTKYNTEGSYGSIDEKILYAHHNLSCDIVSFYDENGTCILSVDDTMENNMLDAINRLYSPFAEFRTGKVYKDGIESISMEERDMIDNKYKQPTLYLMLTKLYNAIKNNTGVYGDVESVMDEVEKFLNNK